MALTLYQTFRRLTSDEQAAHAVVKGRARGKAVQLARPRCIAQIVDVCSPLDSGCHVLRISAWLMCFCLVAFRI